MRSFVPFDSLLIWMSLGRVISIVSESAQVAITKYHKLGGLKTSNLFSHIFGGCWYEVRVPARLGSNESFSPGLQMIDRSPQAHVVYPWCLGLERSYQAYWIRTPSFLTISFNFTFLLKALPPNMIALEFGAEFCRDTVQSTAHSPWESDCLSLNVTQGELLTLSVSQFCVNIE